MADDPRAQLAAQRAAREGGTSAKTVLALLNQNAYKVELARLLASEDMADRFIRVALSECKKTPNLLKCSQESFAGALMVCAQLKLEPSSQLGHIWLVPYWNSKRRVHECQAIVGYAGIIQLALRSAQIADVAAHTVYEHDTFEVEYGTEDRILHRPRRDGDRGHRATDYYAVAKYVNGGRHFEHMTLAEVQAHKKRYVKATEGPWETNFNEMAEKTCIRQMRPYLPASPDFIMAADLDSRRVQWTPQGGLQVDESDLPSLTTETDEDDRNQDDSGDADAPTGNPPAPGDGGEKAPREGDEESATEDAARTVTPLAEGAAVAQQAAGELPLQEGN
jgi:recombination protein RecT